jgi:DNA-nicking Smr family endonuclease
MHHVYKESQSSVIIIQGEGTMGAKKQQPENFSFRPFKKLKQIIDKKGVPITPKQPESVKQPTDEELFNEAMKHVNEIREFREIPLQQKKAFPSRKRRSPDREALDALENIVAGQVPVNLSDTQEYVQWVNKDYRYDIPDRLHQGQHSIQDSLDLHGLILEEAEAEVERFIKDSIKKRHHCIKIIHGRGLRSPNGPVLKDALITWLSGRYRKHLIAFVTARPCDGGLGALYILLR